MFIGNSQKESRYLSSPVYRCRVWWIQNWLQFEQHRLRSDLVPEHGARERFLMGTNVNTPFFQVLTLEFGHDARAWYKVSTLYSGTELGNDISGTQCLNTAPFCAGARVLVLGHQVWTEPSLSWSVNNKSVSPSNESLIKSRPSQALWSHFAL